MSTMNISSLLILAVAITALAYLSPTLVNPVLAQTTTNTEDTTEEEGANTNTAQQDYEEFQRCLTEAEGGDNFATEDENKRMLPTNIHRRGWSLKMKTRMKMKMKMTTTQTISETSQQ